MNTYSWTGTASADFGNAANWIAEASGLPNGSVPGAQDTIDLPGAGVITGTGTVSALNVLDSTGGGYLLAAHVSSNAVSVLGNLNLAYGGQILADTVAIGSAGSFGIMRVSDGTLAALGTGIAVLASDNAVSGPAELAIGTSGQGIGELDLGQGSVILGAGANQAGLLVVGNGLVTGGTSSRIVAGRDGGRGTLSMLSPNSAVDMAGSLVLGLSGSGSAVLDGGTLRVGNGSGGALILGAQDGAAPQQAAGTLQATSATITVSGQMQVGEAGLGAATLTDTTLTTFGLVLGDARAAQGRLTLAGGNWTDTGIVIVGGAGQGALALTTGPSTSGFAHVHGALLIGAAAGSGIVSVMATTLEVQGPTSLGPSASDSITIGAGATWNSAGRLVRLLDAQTGAQGDTLSVAGAGSSLDAGFLSVGAGDTALVLTGAAMHLGGSAAGTAASVSGAVIVDAGSTLTSSGAVAIAGGSGGHGLLLDGSATFTATAGPALSLVAGGIVSVQGTSATLTANGGLLLAERADLAINGGTVAASGPGLALEIAAASAIQLTGGALHTGAVWIDDLGAGSAGGRLTVNGGSLTSTAAMPADAAVTIGGRGAGMASVDLQSANWTVAGWMVVGGPGGAGELSLQNSTVAVSRGLLLGSTSGQGTLTAEAVVSGGRLNPSEHGISAAYVEVATAGSVIEAGTLRVGSVSAVGSMSIAAGTVHVSGQVSVHGTLALGGTLSAGTVLVAAGSVITGSGTLQAGSIMDQGRIGMLGGTLTVTGSITGSGQIGVRVGEIVLSQAETVAVTFGNAGTIVTPSIADLAGTVSGWQPHDAIDFAGEHIASFSLAGDTLSLFDSVHGLLGAVAFAGPVTAANFMLSPDTRTGTVLSFHS